MGLYGVRRARGRRPARRPDRAVANAVEVAPLLMPRRLTGRPASCIRPFSLGEGPRRPAHGRPIARLGHRRLGAPGGHPPRAGRRVVVLLPPAGTRTARWPSSRPVPRLATVGHPRRHPQPQRQRPRQRPRPARRPPAWPSRERPGRRAARPDSAEGPQRAQSAPPRRPPGMALVPKGGPANVGPRRRHATGWRTTGATLRRAGRPPRDGRTSGRAPVTERVGPPVCRSSSLRVLLVVDSLAGGGGAPRRRPRRRPPGRGHDVAVACTASVCSPPRRGRRHRRAPAARPPGQETRQPRLRPGPSHAHRPWRPDVVHAYIYASAVSRRPPRHRHRRPAGGDRAHRGAVAHGPGPRSEWRTYRRATHIVAVDRH